MNAADAQRNRAVIIGINGYYRMGELKYCVADARAVRDQLLRGGVFKPADVVLMTDDATEPQNRPTLANIEQRLQNLAHLGGKMGTLLIFFAGHGVVGGDGGGHLVPVDGSRTRGIPLARVRSWLRACDAQNVILILDACHAGAGTRGVLAIAPSLAAGPGITLFASCEADQQSYDDEQSGHGVFSAYLAAGLSGKADADEDRAITADELFGYVREGVSSWAYRKDRRQTPVVLPPDAPVEVPLARLPAPGREIEIPEFKLPDEPLPALALPGMDGTALERFEKIQDFLQQKRAEIKEKGEWYAESSAQMEALRAQEEALVRQMEDAELKAAETIEAELEAIRRAWAEGERRGWKTAHPEMKKLAAARERAQKQLEPFSPVLAARRQREAARKLGASPELTLDLGGGVTMELVLIPAGEFLMGSPSSESGRDNDERQHRVRITRPFYMGKYEVTQEQYEAVMGRNPAHFKGAKNPVENASWNDAVEFCRRLSARTGHEVRLPTEAEWEYACRAGSSTAYHFGDSESRLGDYAWYSGNSGSKTHPVGGKRPNAWGLYDMHGNVWEWCADWYDSDYYGQSPAADPQGPSSGELRVLRGGSWSYYPGYCRSALRLRASPSSTYLLYGFRVAVSPRP